MQSQSQSFTYLPVAGIAEEVGGAVVEAVLGSVGVVANGLLDGGADVGEDHLLGTVVNGRVGGGAHC